MAPGQGRRSMVPALRQVVHLQYRGLDNGNFRGLDSVDDQPFAEHDIHLASKTGNADLLSLQIRRGLNVRPGRTTISRKWIFLLHSSCPGEDCHIQSPLDRLKSKQEP